MLPKKALTYQEYLKTQDWGTKKLRALSYYFNECAVCGTNKNLDVHHKRYDNIFNEPLNDLVVLCRQHHSKFHDRGDDCSLYDRELNARESKDIRLLNKEFRESYREDIPMIIHFKKLNQEEQYQFIKERLIYLDKFINKIREYNRKYREINRK